MAIMIPREIGYFERKSGEQEMYKALEKLPDDYYVFHSYRVVDATSHQLEEYEIDFLIFNPKYGCLLIEAKNGKIYRDSETKDWHYKDGTKMKNPFSQVASSMYALLKKLDQEYHNTKWQKLIHDCKFLFAIWFPSYSTKEIDELDFGPNFPKDLILGLEALHNPTPYISNIMELIQKKTHYL